MAYEYEKNQLKRAEETLIAMRERFNEELRGYAQQSRQLVEERQEFAKKNSRAMRYGGGVPGKGSLA